MFDSLRSAFSNAAKSLTEKELSEKDIDGVLMDLEIALLESDVAGEVVDAIKSDLAGRLTGSKVDRKEVERFVKGSLVSSISSLFDAAGTVDLIDLVRAKKDQGKPFLILFVGINGTGKTTSLAKVAYMLQKAKFSVVVAAADTFRAGAIEQLREHTNRLNLKLVAQNYNSDPAAVARDAVLYANAHRTDCVLIDTAGRMQTSANLMEQIAKVVKVVSPDFKIFVGDSLAGNDTVSQAREFFSHTKFDGSILTKSDADARGGAALSIVKVTSTPVLYVGTGQEYADLRPFDKDTFLRDVFGPLGDADAPGTLPGTVAPREGAESTRYQAEEAASAEPELEAKVVLEVPKATEPELEARAVLEVPKATEPELEARAVLEVPKATEPEARVGSEVPESEEVEPRSGPEEPASDDPFEGISDGDIYDYSDLFDIPPPENNADAVKLGHRIRQWIKDGRPKNGKAKPEYTGSDSNTKSEEAEERPKKKRGVFGFLGK